MVNNYFIPGLSKQADPQTDAFSSAVGDMAAQQLKSDAWKDVGNMGMAALGVGVAGRGAVGLYNILRRNQQKKPKAGPALLPLPFPIEKAGNFLAGDMASTKAGIPWYGPAMLGVGLGGLGLGWHGMDAAINARRKAESQAALEDARSQFHDALMQQYDAPLRAPAKKDKSESADVMKKVGGDLEAVWDRVAGVLENFRLKSALDLANMGGVAASGYGVYGGLSGLLTGAMVYNAMKKRSRQAVLEKAVQRRDRRRFMQSPTEIYATPEPVEPAEEPKLG